jgi:ribokinase
MAIDDASVACDIDKENCKLQLNYGDKIAAKTATPLVAGNAANAAVGARRLGLSSAFLDTIGDDDTGHKILDKLHQEGVSSDYVTVDPKAPSNFSVVIGFQGERTILVHHEPREYVWNISQAPKWIYLTSMGEGFEAIYEKVVTMVHEQSTKLAYNPGTHQLKKGLDFLKPSIAATSLLFLNREESEELLSLPAKTPIPDLLHKLKDLGPEIVVITDGPDGSYAFDGHDMYQLGIYDGPVIERTGSGDAFATAFTSAIIEGKTIPEAMQWGNANSTAVVAQVGPQAGLLTQDGVQQLIAKNPNVQPTKL